MPTKLKLNTLQQSVSTQTADALPPSSSALRQQLTSGGQQSQLSAQNAESTPTSTNSMSTVLTPTLPESKNDPQLLAGLLKPTVEMLAELKLLTVGRTTGGKLFILLADVFNDDLTLRG